MADEQSTRTRATRNHVDYARVREAHREVSAYLAAAYGGLTKLRILRSLGRTEQDFEVIERTLKTLMAVWDEGEACEPEPLDRWIALREAMTANDKDHRIVKAIALIERAARGADDRDRRYLAIELCTCDPAFDYWDDRPELLASLLATYEPEKSKRRQGQRSAAAVLAKMACACSAFGYGPKSPHQETRKAIEQAVSRVRKKRGD